MDFKQLRSFVAVADCGSFTQAAAQLYTSQPTISAHIRQLRGGIAAAPLPPHHEIPFHHAAWP